MTGQPASVSVVIPVYNCAKYLGEAIESVLKQTEPPYEIVVLDDGSTDETSTVASSFGNRIRYFWQENRGLSSARNAGQAMAQGMYTAFLDSDDLWLPNKLALQRSALDRSPETAMVFGHLEQFTSPDLSADEARSIKIKEGATPGWLASTVMVRRSAFEQIGPFDETIKYGELVDWYARAQDQNFSAVMLPELVARRRIHASNMGRKSLEARRDYARTMKIILDRRRKCQ